jgi:hypothetical protein
MSQRSVFDIMYVHGFKVGISMLELQVKQLWKAGKCVYGR